MLTIFSITSFLGHPCLILHVLCVPCSIRFKIGLRSTKGIHYILVCNVSSKESVNTSNVKCSETYHKFGQVVSLDISCHLMMNVQQGVINIFVVIVKNGNHHVPLKHSLIPYSILVYTTKQQLDNHSGISWVVTLWYDKFTSRSYIASI